MEQTRPGFPGVAVGRNCFLTDLDYAVDIAILRENHGDVQADVNRMHEMASKIGIQINAAKTKILSAGIPAAERTNIVLNGKVLEETNSFKYLGCTFIETDQGKNEIEAGINSARSANCRLQTRLWSSPEIRLATKVRSRQALVRTIILYGCETWPIRKADLYSLEVFDHYFLRRLLRVRPLDMASNPEVRRAAKFSQSHGCYKHAVYDGLAMPPVTIPGSLSARPSHRHLYPDGASDSTANCEHGSGQTRTMPKLYRARISTVCNARDAIGSNSHKNSPTTAVHGQQPYGIWLTMRLTQSPPPPPG